MAYSIQYGPQKTKYRKRTRTFKWIPGLVLAASIALRFFFPQAVLTLREILLPTKAVQAMAEAFFTGDALADAAAVFCNDLYGE